MASAKQKSKRIYIFTHEFFPKKAGISLGLQELVREAAKMGREITLFAPEDPALKEHVFPYKVVPLQNKGTHGWACRWVTMRALLRYKKNIEQGVLCLPEPGPILAFLYLRLLKKIEPQQLILILHGSEILRFGRSWLLRCLFKSLLKNVNRVVLFSRYCEETLCRLFPEAKGKTVITPGALRSEFIPIPAKDVPSKSDCVKLLTVARVHPRKGQMQVLKAISIMPETLKAKVVYQVVGPVIKKDYFRDLKEYAEKNKVNMEYLGEVPEEDLPEYYHKADIFVMASIPYKNSIEGFGLSYLEASASGLPVVGHDTGGVSDAVIHGKTGFLVPEGDVRGLSKVLECLIQDPALRKQMGLAGISFAKKLSWKDNAGVCFQDS